MRFALLLAAFAASCASAHAQPAWEASQAGDVPALTACISTHEDTPGRRECIGAIIRLCHEQAGGAGETTYGAMRCAQREERAWRTILDQSAAQLRARESEAQRAALDAYLQEGGRWMQTRCAYASSLYEGGSLARVVGAHCQRDAIAESALELYSRLHDEP